MKNRYFLLSCLTVLATLAAVLYLYDRLPARIPTHWDAHAEIDEYGPRAVLFIHTGVMALLIALWAVLPKISPRRFTVEEFGGTYWYLCFIVVALIAYIQLLLLWGAYLGGFAVARPLIGGIAIFIALIGNVLGKVRRNFWIGVRTPWTLASERVWYATHRLAAKSMVAGGLLAFGAVVAQLPMLAAVILMALGVLVPVLYSLVYYKRLERSGGLEA